MRTGFAPSAYARAVVIAVSLSLASGCSGDAAAPTTSARDGAAAVPGEVIVRFHAGTTAQRIEAVLKATGTRIDKDLGMPRTYLLRFSDAIPVAEMVRRLRSYADVQDAEANRIVRLDPPPGP